MGITVITLVNLLANLSTMLVKLCTSMCTNSQQEQRMKNTRAIRVVASRLLCAEDAVAIGREQDKLNADDRHPGQFYIDRSKGRVRTHVASGVGKVVSEGTSIETIPRLLRQ